MFVLFVNTSVAGVLQMDTKPTTRGQRLSTPPTAYKQLHTPKKQTMGMAN